MDLCLKVKVFFLALKVAWSGWSIPQCDFVPSIRITDRLMVDSGAHKCKFHQNIFCTTHGRLCYIDTDRVKGFLQAWQAISDMYCKLPKELVQQFRIHILLLIFPYVILKRQIVGAIICKNPCLSSTIMKLDYTGEAHSEQNDSS